MTEPRMPRPKRRLRATLTTQILGAAGGAVASLILVGTTVSIQMKTIDTSTRDAQADDSTMNASILSLQNTLWAARHGAGTVASYPVVDRPDQSPRCRAQRVRSAQACRPSPPERSRWREH